MALTSGMSLFLWFSLLKQFINLDPFAVDLFLLPVGYHLSGAQGLSYVLYFIFKTNCGKVEVSDKNALFKFKIPLFVDPLQCLEN